MKIHRGTGVNDGATQSTSRLNWLKAEIQKDTHKEVRKVDGLTDAYCLHVYITSGERPQYVSIEVCDQGGVYGLLRWDIHGCFYLVDTVRQPVSVRDGAAYDIYLQCEGEVITR